MDGASKWSNILTSLTMMCGMVCMTTLAVAYMQRRTQAIPTVATVTTDTAPLQQIVAIAKTNPKAALKAGKAYQDLAFVVGRKEATIDTTLSFRTAVKVFEASLFAGTDMQSALPGFSKAANDHFEQRLGLDTVPFDDAKRTSAVAALKELTTALGASDATTP